MKTNLISTILIGFLFFSTNAQITFDLADKKTKSEPIDVDIEPVLIIKNMLPDQDKNKYSFEIQREEKEIPAIEIGELSGGTCTEPAELLTAIKNLKTVTEENDVEDKITELNKMIKKNNKPEYKDCIILARKIIAATETTPPKDLEFKIKYNQTITIKVIRITGKDTVTWTRIFKTPTKSPWSVMYGFTFIPNMMNPINNYFSKADTSGKTYTLTKLNNQKNTFLKNVSPTIMVTWKPLTKYSWKSHGGAANNLKSLFSNNCYQFGLVGGFSLNFASDVANANVLIGPSIIFCENLSISVGVAATQKDVLKGQYKEGDVIKDNLDFSQLHDKKYMAEWFVSVSFRFSSNPFKKADSSEDSKSADK